MSSVICWVCYQYRADAPEGVEANIKAAREIAARINAVPGFRALLPHNLGVGFEGSLTDAQWLSFDIEVMQRAANWLVYDRDRSNSEGCMGERLVFAGPQIDQEYFEEVAAHYTAQAISRAVKTGRA